MTTKRIDALRSEGDVNTGAARAEWAARNIDPETRHLLDKLDNAGHIPVNLQM